jgi:hypothetical protein
MLLLGVHCLNYYFATVAMYMRRPKKSTGKGDRASGCASATAPRAAATGVARGRRGAACVDRKLFLFGSYLKRQRQQLQLQLVCQ